MHRTKLRKLRGSVMLAVPRALLQDLRLRPGVQVGITIENGRLVISQSRPRYTLDELLAQCNPEATRSGEDAAWGSDKPAGAEIL